MAFGVSGVPPIQVYSIKPIHPQQSDCGLDKLQSVFSSCHHWSKSGQWKTKQALEQILQTDCKIYKLRLCGGFYRSLPLCVSSIFLPLLYLITYLWLSKVGPPTANRVLSFTFLWKHNKNDTYRRLRRPDIALISAHWLSCLLGFETIEGCIVLSVLIPGGDQFMVMTNIGKSEGQVCANGWVNVWGSEPPIVLTSLCRAVVVAHQPVARGWHTGTHTDNGILCEISFLQKMFLPFSSEQCEDFVSSKSDGVNINIHRTFIWLSVMDSRASVKMRKFSWSIGPWCALWSLYPTWSCNNQKESWNVKVKTWFRFKICWHCKNLQFILSMPYLLLECCTFFCGYAKLERLKIKAHKYIL